jgi:hypothetical protein
MKCEEGSYLHKGECHELCPDFTSTQTKICILKPLGVKYFIDLTVRNMVNVIESKSPSTKLLIFFPSAIMISALALVIVASYLVERKTEFMTLGMVAAMSIERLSSWVLMIYTSAIYISQGLGEVKVLCIVHGVSIGILLIVNTLVVFKFR